MSVQKFRSVEEMNASEPRPRSDDSQAAFDRFARHCARYWHAAPRNYPRGVFRFRDIEGAQGAFDHVNPIAADPDRQ